MMRYIRNILGKYFLCDDKGGDYKIVKKRDLKTGKMRVYYETIPISYDCQPQGPRR